MTINREEVYKRKKENNVLSSASGIIDHSRPSSKTETEYISECLTINRRFARTYRVYMWFIAHSTILLRGKDGKYPIPTLYDIAGPAHFRNKADNGITGWRDPLDGERAV